MTVRKILPVLLLVLCAASAQAAEPPPLEVSAATALEWNRTAKTYTAKGDVVAKRGEAEIRSNTLTAAYEEGGEGPSIRTLTAEGAVTIVSPPYTAHGDKAVYNALNGDAVLTGDNLRVEANEERLTASKMLRYSSKEGFLSAEGNAKAVKGTQTLMADTLTAHFSKNAKGETVTDKITATGRVTITTARETIIGDHGFYNVANQTAELDGNVKITQGRNTLEGVKATVDMQSGLSRLTGAGGDGGRVKGVFYPAKSDN